MNLKPLKDKILISRIAAEKETASGIILKSSDGPDRALVEALADNIDEVEIGDEILINWNGAVAVSGKETDKEFYVVNIKHVILRF